MAKSKEELLQADLGFVQTESFGTDAKKSRLMKIASAHGVTARTGGRSSRKRTVAEVSNLCLEELQKKLRTMQAENLPNMSKKEPGLERDGAEPEQKDGAESLIADHAHGRAHSNSADPQNQEAASQSSVAEANQEEQNISMQDETEKQTESYRSLKQLLIKQGGVRAKTDNAQDLKRKLTEASSCEQVFQTSSADARVCHC